MQLRLIPSSVTFHVGEGVVKGSKAYCNINKMDDLAIYSPCLLINKSYYVPMILSRCSSKKYLKIFYVMTWQVNYYYNK